MSSPSSEIVVRIVAIASTIVWIAVPPRSAVCVVSVEIVSSESTCAETSSIEADIVETLSAVSSSESVCCSAEPASSPIASVIARTLRSAPSTICDCSAIPSSSCCCAIAPPSMTASDEAAVVWDSLTADPRRCESERAIAPPRRVRSASDGQALQSQSQRFPRHDDGATSPRGTARAVLLGTSDERPGGLSPPGRLPWYRRRPAVQAERLTRLRRSHVSQKCEYLLSVSKTEFE